MNSNIVLLVKKYLNNNVRVLSKIYKLSKGKETVYYSDIESYLNRGKNQISLILSKLESDNLISRNKENRPQKIVLTSMGENLMEAIYDLDALIIKIFAYITTPAKPIKTPIVYDPTYLKLHLKGENK